MKIIKQALAILLLTLSMSIAGHTEIIRNIRSNSRIIEVPMPSFLYKVNIGTGIGGSYDLNISTTSSESPYGLKFSTSVYAPAWYGDGSNLTGIEGVTNHNLLTSTGMPHVDLDILISDLETSTSTLEGYIFDLWSSTSILESYIFDLWNSTNTLETSIVNLEISTSTLEGYIFDLWDSTQTLELAGNLNTIHRSSNGIDHSYIDQDVTTSGTPTFSSTTITYGITAGTGTFTEGMQAAEISIIGQYTFDTIDGINGYVQKTNGEGILLWDVDNIRIRKDYDVLIASHPWVGVDVVYQDGRMDVALNEAEKLLPSGGDVHIKSGFVYVFKVSATITTADIKIHMNGAIFYGHEDLTTYSSFDRHILQTETTATGFEISGGKLRANSPGSRTYSITGLYIRGNKSKVFDMSIVDLGQGSGYNNSAGIYIDPADDCSVVNVQMDYASGAYGLHANGARVYVNNVSVSNTRFGMNFNDYDSLCEGFLINGADTAIRVTNNDRHIFSDFIILNTADDAFNLGNGNHKIMSIADGLIYECGNQGIESVGANMDSVTIDNVYFWNIGTDGGDQYDAIYFWQARPQGLTISNCNFMGTIDRYCIYLLDSTIYANIVNNQFHDITGNVHGDVNEFMFIGGSTSVNIWGNQPADEIKNYVVNESSFTTVTIGQELTVNGTFYYNASSAEISMDDNASVTTVIASTSTFYQIEGTYISDDLIGFTVSGSSFTYTGLGGANKKFKVDANVSELSNAARTISHLAVFKNGSKIGSASSRMIDVAFDEGNHTIIKTTRLSEGDIIQIRISGDKSAEIIAEHTTVIITQIN